MLTTIDISKTEPNWIELFRRAKEKGLRYLITDGEQEMFEISVAKPPKQDERILDLHPGAMIMSDDFDEPLPDSFWLGDDNQHERTELNDRDYMLSLAGTVSSGASDTSENVKAIVSEAILKKYG